MADESLEPREGENDVEACSQDNGHGAHRAHNKGKSGCKDEGERRELDTRVGRHGQHEPREAQEHARGGSRNQPGGASWSEVVCGMLNEGHHASTCGCDAEPEGEVEEGPYHAIDCPGARGLAAHEVKDVPPECESIVEQQQPSPNLHRTVRSLRHAVHHTHHHLAKNDDGEQSKALREGLGHGEVLLVLRVGAEDGEDHSCNHDGHHPCPEAKANLRTLNNGSSDHDARHEPHCGRIANDYPADAEVVDPVERQPLKRDDGEQH
mmetsp:Transcript_5842/g.15929  ORF Transcript_5842/g.15929 Transcript_5842/m.15929 type:complete len:265 (-) Transcript_5842:389-1183(-)|eukprot:CAMPEP_0185197820 /NCGR_PEP_ID=MMETSP1140-20130426/41365_1 /TAXON_ID=298111 /ORGANISM="Pavlova sp., Strain CCMP459" /LENGTH=264 /DNA_ID=CAMNT_0027764963 /DNA_START=488 /DNA_END=1282 /DNA_ORIENTATION=-